jgi:hypothetical protein
MRLLDEESCAVQRSQRSALGAASRLLDVLENITSRVNISALGMV